jgi:Flp pilus assembly protein TadG
MLRQRQLSQFLTSQRGSVAIIFGFTLMIMSVLIGAGIDIGRQFLARRVSADAIDAAVLAGGRWLQAHQDDVTGAVAQATSYYQKNTANRIPLKTDTVQFIAADNNRSLTATGEATIATTFLAIAGINQLHVIKDSGSGFAKATVSVGGTGGSNLEVSIMLDVTGSMCDNGMGPCTTGSKITALKSAVSELINTVVANDQSPFMSRVALVPFSTRVRVGPDGGGATMMKRLTNLDALASFWYDTCTLSTGTGGSEGGGNWVCVTHQTINQTNWKVMPCVTERYYQGGNQFDVTDDLPSAGHWLNAHDGTRGPIGRDSSNASMATGRGDRVADPYTGWNYDQDGGCADLGNENEILPLTSNKTTLLNKINSLSAYGATAGALGTSWAWYMLSPNWSTIWTGASAPGSYADVSTIQATGAPLLRKVAILMTDGGYDAIHSDKDQNQAQVSAVAVAACTAMKAKGVEVYTIGFELNQLPASQQPTAIATLKSCGTDINHFYQTLTPNDLGTAFRDISNRLSGLRLTH